MPRENETPIENLRRMVKYFDYQNESLNGDLSLDELFKVWRFMDSEQGGRVNECYDTWPPWFIEMVVGYSLPLPEEAITDVNKEC
jgi:hypothetical protein